MLYLRAFLCLLGSQTFVWLILDNLEYLEQFKCSTLFIHRPALLVFGFKTDTGNNIPMS